MNSDAINIAIAKLLGYSCIDNFITKTPKDHTSWNMLPDYCHDLNAAMAAAEQAIKEPLGLNIVTDIYDGQSKTSLYLFDDPRTVWATFVPISTPDRLATAICKVILRAHGVTVASQQEGGNE